MAQRYDEREPPHCATCACGRSPIEAPPSQPGYALSPGDSYALGYNDGMAMYASREQEIRDAHDALRPTHFAFLIKRPIDSQSWATIFASRERSEAYEHRASPVVPVRLPLFRFFEIWMEGYRVTGNESDAQYKGSWPGNTFADACETWAKSTESPNLFDRGALTYWGCRLFDNETDARKSFG